MSSVNPLLYVIILSLFPGIEIRGALAYAKYAGLDFFHGAVVPLMVSMLITLIVYLVTYAFLQTLMRWGLFRRYVESTRSRVEKYINQYGFWGLLLFVAIPLPGTGLYTGSFGAVLLGMPRLKSIIALYLGNLIAFVILSLILFL